MASRFDQLLDAFWQTLADSTVTRAKGRRSLAVNDKLPRITHIGLGAELLSPDYVGEGLQVNAVNGTESRDKIIAVRKFQILMVIQGQNEEQAEQLHHNALSAWFQTCSGAVEFSEEQWPDQQEGADDWERRGNTIVSTVTIAIPVYNKSKPLTRVTAWGEDGIFTTGTLYGQSKLGSGVKYTPGEIVC